jgi:N-hydroxyarylamine O-acetyltransferase
MCQFHQHSPDSHFTQKRICSLATPQGRVSLSDHKLIETQPPLRSERLLASPNEYSQILKTVFDITLPSQTGEATA